MNGDRLNSVKEALLSFVPNVCEFEHVIMKLILFCHETAIDDIAKNANDAKAFLEANVKATGGTDFHMASKALVNCANDILEKYPDYQVMYCLSLCVCLCY